MAIFWVVRLTLLWTSSTAAEEMETAPVPILVSVRTLRPAVIACLNKRSNKRLIPLYFCPNLWVFRT